MLKSSPVQGEKAKDREKTFSFDFAFDSTDTESSTFASQEKIFQELGSGVLKAAFEGFNACMFAYGQTGSGKSHTMMGLKDDKGLIPRICEGLFMEMSERSKTDAVSFHTEVSYLEIYNERVQDLLKKKPSPTTVVGLKVREHPRNGPYVENLSKHVVHSHGDVEGLILLGNTNRTVASTGMNDESSRSHAIFTITFTQAWFDAEFPRELISKIHLVDLAGSERADSTQSRGIRLKEGANINKSLVTLGSVISALADQSLSEKSTKRRKIFIPYRDSVLTWLLKDSLGGNSITTMIATISPAEVNYEETLSTLRYASRAKSIVNTPTVNEDGSVKVIRELQAEVARLQTLLAEATQVLPVGSCVLVEEKLHQKEAKVVALKKKWAGKWNESILQEETVALRKERSGVVLDCQLPHLIGMDEDLLRTGIILYHLKEGRTCVGSNEALSSLDIVLHGAGVLDEHCVLENSGGNVTLVPQEGSFCSVNGSVATAPCLLTQGSVVQLGRGTLLRYNHPTEASQLRPNQQAIPGRDPVPSVTFELDGDTLQDGTSTRDGQELQGDWCHKSGPGLLSEGPQRTARSGAARFNRDEVWSGNASLQQTSVLGPGDGCGRKPGGDANEIQGPVTDFFKGRPGSGGSSLGSESHLQGRGGSICRSNLQQTSPPLDTKPLSSQVARCPPRDTSFQDQFSCEEMDESGGLEEIPAVCVTEATAATVQLSRLGALFSNISSIVQDAKYLLFSSPAAGQQAREVRLLTFGARWSSHVVSVVRESHVLSMVKDSHVFSMVGGHFASSLFAKSPIFSVLKDLPVVQHIQLAMASHLQHMEAGLVGSENLAQDAPKSLAESAAEKETISKDGCSKDLQTPQRQERENSVKQGAKAAFMSRQVSRTETRFQTKVGDQPLRKSTMARIQIQPLIKFPDPLLNLQTLPFQKLIAVLQTTISASEFNSQKVGALYWLTVAKCSQPEPQPALLVLTETDLYTLTADSGLLVLFHQLSLFQLKDVHVGLAGQSVRFMGTTEESILAVYTHNQKMSKKLCCSILDIVSPGECRVSQHPLLIEDLMKISLDRQVFVPDLLLDSGLKICCQFQKSLADLLYVLHCNMDQNTVTLGEMQLLMYTSVGVHVDSGGQHVAQFLLTDSHLGLLRADAVFHPPPQPVTTWTCCPQFYDLTVSKLSDVRCMLVHDEDKRGAVRLDRLLFCHSERSNGNSGLSRKPGNHTSITRSSLHMGLVSHGNLLSPIRSSRQLGLPSVLPSVLSGSAMPPPPWSSPADSRSSIPPSELLSCP
ncbi:Kinesin-like protein KIF16B [Oryzias melastigma]|uniref:Kinesin-like protein KIF16B n=1 Tax=Oryzias melastigma TaxID=30732 RepID=A0A834C692_ORYME|nr:Kinesin-like protein KIF16B [Oryzias melastigma]